MFDALHHVARPVDALRATTRTARCGGKPLSGLGRLRAMRALVADSGTVLIVESRAGEHFSCPLPEGDFERFFYMVSVMH